MYAQSGDPNCTVQSLKLYLSKLHPKCEALFQKLKTGMVEQLVVPESCSWYSQVDNMVKDIPKLPVFHRNSPIIALEQCVPLFCPGQVFKLQTSCLSLGTGTRVASSRMLLSLALMKEQICAVFCIFLGNKKVVLV